MTDHASAVQARRRSSAAGTHDPRPNRQRQRRQARAVAIRHSMEDTR
jgi:hypothetical protein